jgi:hypothetical protein
MPDFVSRTFLAFFSAVGPVVVQAVSASRKLILPCPDLRVKDFFGRSFECSLWPVPSRDALFPRARLL